MTSKIHICFVFILLLSSAVIAENFGKIAGLVSDKTTGKPLAGANVFISELGLGAATDVDGKYFILKVPPGEYDVEFHYIGYKSVVVKDVKIRVNRVSYCDIESSESVLESEEIVVIGNRPLVDKDITATTRSVQYEDMKSLPVVNVNEVLTLQPGMVNDNGLHFRGGRSGELVYYMDGVPMVNPLYQEIRSTEVVNLGSVQEMQVISGTFGAEYGNSMSGVINITTKEGGKELDFDLDYRTSTIGFETASKDQNRHVFIGSISGPLFSQKNTFFLSANYDDRDSYLPWGYRKEYNLFAKITDTHIKNLKISASANISNGNRKSYSHSYKYIPDMYWIEPNTESRMGQIGITHTLSHKLFYTLNFYGHYYHYDSGDFDYRDLTSAYRLDENNEFYEFNMVSSFEKNDQTTFGLQGNMIWQANAFNEVKGGFEYRRHDIKRFYISSPYEDDHILDDYRVNPYEGAVFLQDKINFKSLIVSAGLRFDFVAPNIDYYESPYDVFYGYLDRKKSSKTHTQLSPRLGISYPVLENTVFHFGFGHYFQRPAYQFIYKTLTDEMYEENLIMNLRSGNGRYGNPDLQPEKTIQYEFGLSHQLFDDYLLNVAVYAKIMTDYTGTRTYYAGDSSATGESYWETFSVHINEDFAYNNGVEVQLRKILGRNFFGEINYTYAVAEGSSSGPFERLGSEEANRQSLKFFPLDFDQRHSVNAVLTYKLNKGEGYIAGTPIFEDFTTTLVFSYNSGLPYTKGTRGATEPYEINNARLPETWNIDLRMDKKIYLGQLTLIPYLEISNLTDRQNVLYVDPFTGQPDYIEGRTEEWAANPLNWGPPRLIFLGLRLRY